MRIVVPQPQSDSPSSHHGDTLEDAPRRQMNAFLDRS